MPQGVKISLSPKELIFVDAFVNSGDSRAALHVAGYAPTTHPDMVLQRPIVQAAVQARTHMRLAGVGAVLSIGYLLAVVEQGAKHVAAGGKPTREYNAAAVALADRSGFSVRSQQVRDDKIPELGEMTQEELRAFIDQGEAELARRAKEVSAAIEAAPRDEAIDLFS